MKKITIELEISETEEGAWRVADNAAPAEGIAEYILLALEEWMYGFISSVQGPRPLKATKEFIQIQQVYDEQQDTD